MNESEFTKQLSLLWAEKARALPVFIRVKGGLESGDRQTFTLCCIAGNPPPVADWPITFEVLHGRLLRDHGPEVSQTEFADMAAIGREIESAMAIFHHACAGETPKTVIHHSDQGRFVVVRLPEKYTPHEYDFGLWAELMSGTVFNGRPVAVQHTDRMERKSWTVWPATFAQAFQYSGVESLLLGWTTMKGVGEPPKRAQL